MVLTNEQLWEKVRGLQGRIVCTPQQQKRNLVVSVSRELVTFQLVDENRDRRANLSREDVLRCYCLAMQYGVLTKQNLPEDFFNRRIARVCMGLLADAVPEQIRVFRKGEGPLAAQGLSGIEVYSRDC